MGLIKSLFMGIGFLCFIFVTALLISMGWHLGKEMFEKQTIEMDK